MGQLTQIRALGRRLRALGRLFGRDHRGNIAVLFGLTTTALLLATGAGIDLSRAYQARQKLAQIAVLACQYASRPSVVQYVSPSYSGANGGTTYTTSVNGYITASLDAQQFGWSQTNGAPFSYTSNGPADVNLTASVPTSLMKIAGINQLTVAGVSHCYDSPSSINQTVPNGASPYVIQEGFEAAPCAGTCWFTHNIPGRSNTTPTNTFVQSAPTYNGATGGSWYATGFCLETDSVGIISSSVPEGVRSAELDCENGSGTAGNSAISTKAYLPVGNYELRYNYRSRVTYLNYDPVVLCGSTASDLSWANDTSSSGGPVANAFRTNQMNVYLDLNVGGAPPLHTTLDGTQQLAGSNLIDMCVYAGGWVERSVRIYVTNPGFYWLSFAADGQNDSFGAQLDNIRLCSDNCPGTLQDNFPAAWLAANNGGVNKVLFQDTFEAPAYSANYFGIASTNGNLNVSTGTSGTAAAGWPTQTASGWATAPYNEVVYLVSGSAQGNQSIQLDSSTPSTNNRLASRPFLLMPGYYKVDYRYVPDVYFPSLSATYCGATPGAANISGLSGSAAGVDRFFSSAVTTNRDTNIVGLFMSHAQLASTPIGGGALNAQTSYLNPNGTTTTTPTVAPNGVSLTSYNAAQANPLLDICGYATSWQSRTANIKITKPAYYWLTFSALGTADSYGGAIDDVRLTALGSLYMASPPASPVTIPVPNPQPGSQVTYTGFYIIADPLTPTAPLQ